MSIRSRQTENSISASKTSSVHSWQPQRVLAHSLGLQKAPHSVGKSLEIFVQASNSVMSSTLMAKEIRIPQENPSAKEFTQTSRVQSAHPQRKKGADDGGADVSADDGGAVCCASTDETSRKRTRSPDTQTERFFKNMLFNCEDDRMLCLILCGLIVVGLQHHVSVHPFVSKISHAKRFSPRRPTHPFTAIFCFTCSLLLVAQIFL